MQVLTTFDRHVAEISSCLLWSATVRNQFVYLLHPVGYLKLVVRSFFLV